MYLLFAWKQRFDSLIRVKISRFMALLVENCISHGSYDTSPILKHV